MGRNAVAGRIALAGVVLAGIGGSTWMLGSPGMPSYTSTAAVSAALPSESLDPNAPKLELVVPPPSGTPTGADVISKQAPPPPTHTERYHNDKYGFEYWHSPQAKVTEYDEGSGATTIVHENFERVRGMQIFILPYAEATISEERFRADVPSGVRENVENTTLDGIPAVTFNSFDPALGETREIWVIHNGFLYEITTMRGVGNWFTPIIQSWNFTR